MVTFFAAAVFFFLAFSSDSHLTLIAVLSATSANTTASLPLRLTEEALIVAVGFLTCGCGVGVGFTWPGVTCVEAGVGVGDTTGSCGPSPPSPPPGCPGVGKSGV